MVIRGLSTNPIQLLRFFLIPLVFIHGCGYSLHPALVSDIDSIHISTFKNNTYEHNLEGMFLKTVTEEFILDGNLRIKDESVSDARLKGEIIGFELKPFAYGEDESSVEQYRIEVTVDASLVNLRKSSEIWREKITGDASYYTSGSLSKTKEEALRLALRDIAKTIVERTVRTW